jgi:hypothetical protein
MREGMMHWGSQSAENDPRRNAAVNRARSEAFSEKYRCNRS